MIIISSFNLHNEIYNGGVSEGLTKLKGREYGAKLKSVGVVLRHELKVLVKLMLWGWKKFPPFERSAQKGVPCLVCVRGVCVWGGGGGHKVSDPRFSIL